MRTKSSLIDDPRWWDLFSVILIFLLLQILTIRISITGWIDHLDSLPGLVIPAFILGLMLGYSRFPGWVCGGMALFHGFVSTMAITGMYLPRGLSWLDKTGEIINRLRFSLLQISESVQVDDSLLFFVMITLLIWIVSTAAGYYHTRHGSAWVVLIPPAILFLLVDRFDLSAKLRSGYFFFFILIYFLLLIRTGLVQKRREWLNSEIQAPPGIISEFTRLAGLVTLVLLTALWLLPAFSQVSNSASRIWREMTRPLDSTRDRIANALAPLKSSNPSGMALFYDTMSIGHTTNQEGTVIFTARAFARDPLLYRYYWRTRSYDHYENGNWKSNADVEIDQTKEFTQPAVVDWKARRELTFQITTLAETMNTYVTEQSPYQITLASRIFGIEITPGVVDVDYLKPEDPIARGTSYRVSSLKSIPTINQLQNTGMVYPEWVSSNYLQLPQNINPLISRLAQNIVKGKNNPYDRVSAITEYLRENYKYLSNLPLTPPGEDPIDIFLFEDRQGFCNHFATAEVLLLRSIGIPARMNVGFAEGEYREETKLYVVRIKDIHAWPEVYFEGYGWVIFEPTTNQAPLVFEEPTPEEEQLLNNTHIRENLPFLATPAPELNPGPPAENLPLKRLPFNYTQNFLPLVIIVLVEAGGITFLFMMLLKVPDRSTSFVAIMESGMLWSGIKPPHWLMRWSAYMKRLPMEQTFLVPDMLFSLLKLPPNPGQTVRERVELWENLLPEIQPFSSVLLNEYEKDLYGSGHGDYALAFQASRMIARKIIRAAVFRILHLKDKSRD